MPTTNAIGQAGLTGQPLYPYRGVFLWAYFPALAQVAGRAKLAGGLYRELLERWRKAHGRSWSPEHPVTVSRQVRLSLMQEVERRIVQRDEDDAWVVLAV